MIKEVFAKKENSCQNPTGRYMLNLEIHPVRASKNEAGVACGSPTSCFTNAETLTRLGMEMGVRGEHQYFHFEWELHLNEKEMFLLGKYTYLFMYVNIYV